MNLPSRNDCVTPRCLACDGPLPPGRPRRTCSDACRQAAWRRRHHAAEPLHELPRARPAKPVTVYECPECGTRVLGEQRCDECRTFMRKLGRGGTCPCCDEPVTVDELLDGAR